MKTFEQRITENEDNHGGHFDSSSTRMKKKKRLYFSVFKSIITKSFSSRTTTADGSGTSEIRKYCDDFLKKSFDNNCGKRTGNMRRWCDDMKIDN